MQAVSITPDEYVEVKECLEDPVHVNSIRWFRACNSLKPFWYEKDNGQKVYRGKPVDLDIMYQFVEAYYDVYWYHQCESDDEMKLQHPLDIHFMGMDDPDDFGIDYDDMRDFAYKCLKLNPFCMYFFRFLNDDIRAADIVLNFYDEDYIISFKSCGHIWFEGHSDDTLYDDLDGDDFYNPLVLFDGLMKYNEAFVHRLIEKKFDAGGSILHFLSCIEPLSKNLLEKWLSCQRELIELISDEPAVDLENLETTYNYYKVLCK